MEIPREFDLIARHFRPLAGEGALGLLDDAAVLGVPAGRELVVSTDAMVEGVHFLAGTNPGVLARKLLRVNLSDLAAMGAAPLGYLVALSVPRGTGDGWFAGFAAGLAADQELFGIKLLGGDTTTIREGTVGCVTVLGTVPAGGAVRRSGARVGDLVYVTGTIGDGVLGLAAARGEIEDRDGYLRGRYELPMPRLGLGICGVASAAMDVSDGLVQECGHIARASGVRVVVRAGDVPVSDAGRRFPERLGEMLAGGDDYELLVTVAPEKEEALVGAGQTARVALTRIGMCEAGGPEVRVLGADREVMRFKAGGWSHF